jgi:hypothetical protein
MRAVYVQTPPTSFFITQAPVFHPLASPGTVTDVTPAPE